jgi:hypothetical protein
MILAQWEGVCFKCGLRMLRDSADQLHHDLMEHAASHNAGVQEAGGE